MSNTNLSLDTLELIDPKYYAQNGYPFEEWKLLREEAPVYWFDRLPGIPFWAITRHEDIIWVSKQPELFLNAPRLVVGQEAASPTGEFPVRMLLNMDPPDHHRFRALVNKRFTPRALEPIWAQVDDIASEILDAVTFGSDETEFDFVQHVSARLPIWVIAEMLGVPRGDWKLIFDWTNRTIGAGDPEYQEEGKTPIETMQAARLALFQYFQGMTEDRLKNPKDDLVSVLSHSKVDGEPLPVFELMSYYFLLVVAGNETTRNATSGGLKLLMDNPDQLALAQKDPSLLKPMVEEVLRMTSPVIHFTRTAAEDVEFHGKKIRKGESLCLFYPSANRDERVFDEPDRFRIDRKPNRHIAFGIGEHLCMGAHVARIELQVMFRHILARLDHVEPAGELERLQSSIVGGIKHMPVRWKLRPAEPAI